MVAKSGPLGGFCLIQGVEAGTYTISIRFKASENSLSVKNRRLQVGVMGNGS